MESNERAAQDLAYIRRVMADAENVRRLSIFGFVVWGSATILAVAFAYLLVAVNRSSFVAHEWWVFTAAAGSITYFHYRKKSLGSTYLSDRVLEYVWAGLAASFLLLTFVVGLETDNFQGRHLYFVMVQIQVAVAVFVTGGIYRLTAFKVLAVVQWCGGVVLGFLPGTWVPLGFGVFVGLGFLMVALVSRLAESKAFPTREFREGII